MTNNTGPVEILTEVSTGDEVRLHFGDGVITHHFQPESPFETEVTLSMTDHEDDDPTITTRVDFKTPPREKEADTYFIEHFHPPSGEKHVSLLRAERREEGYVSEWAIQSVDRVEIL